MLGLLDTLRQIQGDGLGRLGLGLTEGRYRVVATGARWRLRAYLGATAGPPLLIVAAPIKRPYIGDLLDSVSVVRQWLQNRLHLYLLEWRPPSRADKAAGLAAYATQSVGEACSCRHRFALRGQLPFSGCDRCDGADYPLGYGDCSWFAAVAAQRDGGPRLIVEAS